MENMVNGAEWRIGAPAFWPLSTGIAAPLEVAVALRLGFRMHAAPFNTRSAVTTVAPAIRRPLRPALALLPLLLAAACTSTGASSPNAEKAAAAGDTSPQPAIANYACADGNTLTIRNVGTSIRLIGPNGMEEELPAAPANQRSRYGEAHDAIVLDGREALVMTGGRSPITCTR